MGWVWKNDDDSDHVSSSSGDFGEFRGSSNVAGNGAGGRCATRKVVTSQCRTEEVEPGKFIRKCEKTEQVFKDCAGRPSEMVQSNKEYSEEDVTDQMVKGSFPFKSAEHGPSYFPGLRNDIEAIERNFVGGIERFFQVAEEMKDEFFRSVGAPHIYDNDAPSSHRKHGIHIEGHPPKEAFPKKNSDGNVDLSGLARDV
ncbi:UNVERIFIED_CONTAM: Fra a 1-associated protein [Sesamum radiatum]|uniref:Fra a 1-associated protein n=1 Tax=Sesamum radiatum TaxID=300843 RepID=A0AAW2R3N3_SESRA